MKYNIFKLGLYLMLLTTFFSCTKDQSIDSLDLENITIALRADKTDTIPINYATETNQAINLNWNNPNYQFTSGVNSQNVIYTLQIDSNGKNFSGPNKQEIGISSNLSIGFTQIALNVILGDLKLPIGIPAKIEIRIKATINGVASTAIYSNIRTYKVQAYTPPPKVTLPAAGNLWIIGDVTAGGWDNSSNNTVLVNNQKFTKVNNTTYKITINLLKGEYGFKILQEIGNWNNDYLFGTGAYAAGTFYARNNGADGDNFPPPPTAGRFTITLDFQTGTYTLVPAN